MSEEKKPSTFEKFLSGLMEKVGLENQRMNFSRIAERVGKTKNYYQLNEGDTHWGMRSRMSFLKAQVRVAEGKPI